MDQLEEPAKIVAIIHASKFIKDKKIDDANEIEAIHLAFFGYYLLVLQKEHDLAYLSYTAALIRYCDSFN